MFVSRDLDDSLQRVTDELDALLSTGLEPADAKHALAAIKALEVAARKLSAAQAEIHQRVEQRGLHREDGHFSPRVMVRHAAQLSGAEAAARARTAATMRDLPEIADRFRRGRLGVPQMRVIARIHGNPRVRPFMAEAQDWFIEHAEHDEYPDFAAAALAWESLADDDGPDPAPTRNRSFQMTQDGYDKSWTMKGRCGSEMGASMSEIFDHYLRAETLADWEKARAEHGADTTDVHLPRTVQQRRADALWQIFHDAATNRDGGVPVGFTHNIVWSAEAYEEMLRRLAGADSTPLELDQPLCRTLDGVQVDVYEAAANSLVNQVRRVVVDAAGMVIDQGRARTFTGGARLAVQLPDQRCL